MARNGKLRAVVFHAKQSLRAVLTMPDRLAWYRSARRLAAEHARCERPGRPLHVALVTEYARARELKLAYAARLQGLRTSLIARLVQDPDVVHEYYDECVIAANPWQMLEALCRLRPDVTHLFVSVGRADRMLRVLRSAPSPVVFDPYDCSRGMRKTEYRSPALELEAERACFEEADHVCARSLEPRYLRRKFGYSLKGTTYFPEYCWRKPRPRPARRVGPEDELHLVYAGGVMPEDRYPADQYGHAQYIEIGRKLARQLIHLHIYPAPYPSNEDFDNFFSSYIQEGRRNKFFHIHRPLSYEQFMAELGKHDAALHILGVGIDDALGQCTRAKADYSMANKLFDYIEAGLPIVLHRGKCQSWMVRRYGRPVHVESISDVRRALVSELGSSRKARPPCDLKSMSGRMAKMYRSVAGRDGVCQDREYGAKASR